MCMHSSVHTHMCGYVCVYIHMHICNVTNVLMHRSSKSAKHLEPFNSDTEEDTLSTTHTRSRASLKDLSSFDRASKKFLEEMKDTFLKLEKEAKVRTKKYTHVCNALIFRSWKSDILLMATIIFPMSHTPLPLGVLTLCHHVIGKASHH